MPSDAPASNPKLAKIIKLLFTISVLIIVIDVFHLRPDGSQPDTATDTPASATTANSNAKTSGSISLADSQDDLAMLMSSKRSGQMVEFSARIVKVLPDDSDGSKHQRFLLAIDNSRAPSNTVLIAHNIDLAQRVPVDEDDIVRVYGQFEWNDRGGVVHWTHHDPGGRHSDGWIELDGTRYD